MLEQVPYGANLVGPCDPDQLTGLELTTGDASHEPELDLVGRAPQRAARHVA